MRSKWNNLLTDEDRLAVAMDAKWNVFSERFLLSAIALGCLCLVGLAIAACA